MSRFNDLFSRHWKPLPTLILAGVLAALYFGATGTIWAVTGEFTRWGGNLLQLAGVDPAGWAYFKIIKLKGEPWDRLDGWLVFGMLAGGLASALASRSFKLRLPARRRRLVQGLAGGVIAGFGTRLAMGCNLAAFFTGLPQFSFHAWLFIAGTAAGTYAASHLVVMPWFRGAPRITEHPMVRTRDEAPASRQPAAALAMVAALAGLAAFEFAAGKAAFAGVLLAGAVFGLLLQRGQICFTASLRDLWLTGRGTMAKAILAGMAAQTVLTAVFIARGEPAIIHWASPGALLGGLLFGVGIVIAGGCETGWMYRLMEGQLQFVAVGVGNVIGATVLAYGWDHWGIADRLVKGWPELDLVRSFGLPAALVMTFAFLGVAYGLVTLVEALYLRRLERARQRAEA